MVPFFNIGGYPTFTMICYVIIIFSVNKGIQVLFNLFYSRYLLNTIIYLSSNGTRPLLPDIKSFNGNPRWLSTLALTGQMNGCAFLYRET